TKPFNSDKLRGLLLTMSNTILRERTRYARLPFFTTVTCRRGTEQFKLGSLNISEYGMLFESSSGLEPGQEINLDLTFSPGQEHLSLRAMIVHKEPPDLMGVQFHDPTAEDQETIRQYVRSGLKETISGQKATSRSRSRKAAPRKLPKSK